MQRWERFDYMFGICLRHVWDMFGTCLRHVWDMFWTCLGHVWNMFGTRVNYVLNIKIDCQQMLKYNTLEH